LQAARGENTPLEPVEDGTVRVLSALRARGALFASELLAETSLPAAALDEALWDAVARGLVASDGFQPVRTLVAARPRTAEVTPNSRRRSLRRGARDLRASEGRWALLPAVRAASEADSLAEAVAEQLLLRWGVVIRELVQREVLSVPYRDVIWALRRLEARGSVRGGRFVAGFVGEQYALPEAVELLRSVRKSDRKGELVRLSACDPLNLIGVVVPGPKVPSIRTHSISYCDGAPVLEPGATLSTALAENP
jgi:ATP-dependent Lhr-like helicase